MNDATLVELATKAEQAVSQHKMRRESANLVQALQTRLDGLAMPANHLSALTTSAVLLRQRGLPRPERATVNRLQKLIAKLSKIRENLAAATESIVQANALPLADLEDVCERLDHEMSEFWKKHVTGVLPNDSVLTTFEKHASWAPIVHRIRGLKKALQDSATELPQTPDEVAAVDRQVAAAQREFEKLPDLSEKKKLFLRRSVDPGVTLADLLADDEMLVWIKQQGLDRDLRVVSR